MNDVIEQLGLIDDEAIELDAAALQLAALDHPDVDLSPYLDLLAELTERLATVGAGARTAEAQADALRRVLSDEHGFAGDRETYDDPANADMIRLIDRRRGLPVILVILYIAAARRLGWNADALNTPGHVLARIGPATAPALIDPFNRGRLVGAEQLAGLLAQLLEPAASPSAEHLAPMPNRAVLTRLLLNQATRAEAGGNPARALTLYERITVISPGNGNGWWERARLELVCGDVAAARTSLSAMLEITRDPETRLRVSEALKALATAKE